MNTEKALFAKARKALARHAAKEDIKTRMPSFVGAGASGGKLRLSERAEELLFGES